MNEITKVILENEMDLILAHKQSMRLAELAGLSLPAQTTFATAVSEVSRSAIGSEHRAFITLNVSDREDKLKYITAVLTDKRANYSPEKDEGYKYAKRLVPFIETATTEGENRIALHYRLAPTVRVTDSNIERWRVHLNTDPAISPYEEIKRKNRQLVELADKLRESEQQYKSLTDSLPMMIFSMNEEGNITYANQWLSEYTGSFVEEINASKWRNILHPDDYDDIWANWNYKTANAQPRVTLERRLREQLTGEYRWHTGTITAITDNEGNILSWNVFMVDIHAQKLIAAAFKDNMHLKAIQAELEEKVNQLNQSNQQLAQFAYIASHDLQEPLRKISFYGDYIKERYSTHIPQEGQMFFMNMINAADRMKILIQDILAYSTVHKDAFTTADLNQVAAEALHDLEISIKEKHAVVSIAPLPVIQGNPGQLKQLFENLISNSLKFYQPELPPVITISATITDDEVMLSFTDNGIGFEERYIDKLFTLFQRLNARDKYSGTGIGLAICKKITDLHGGSITARSQLNHGATFIITLPLQQAETQNH